MYMLTNYGGSGLQVVTPDPPDAGGAAINANFKVLATMVAASDPGADDDATAGFGIGSRWYNSATTIEWICLDAAPGAAEWAALAFGYLPIAGGTITGSLAVDGSLTSGGSTLSGTGTTALGYQSYAQGNGGTAIGLYASAVGPYGAVAIGYGASVDCYAGSVALGHESTANATNGSVAMGYYSSANGSNGSVAIGYTDTASGQGTTSIGYANTASNSYATALGQANTASGEASTAVGYSNTAGYSGATAIGFENTATGYASIAMGVGNTAGATCSVALGAEANASKMGQMAAAFTYFSAAGDNQRTTTSLWGTSSAGVPVELTGDGSAPAGTAEPASNRFIVPSGKSFGCLIDVMGRQDNGDTSYFLRQCVVKNVSGTVSLQGSVQTLGTDINPDSWTVTIQADAVNGSLQILCTGASGGSNYRWRATVRADEIVY